MRPLMVLILVSALALGLAAPAAYAGDTATNVALGLASFAVFNQLFGAAVYASPPPVYVPPPPPVVYAQPQVVVVQPPPQVVVVPATRVYYAPVVSYYKVHWKKGPKHWN